MTFLGADTDALRALAHHLDLHAKSMRDVGSRASASVASAEWEGPDHDHLLRETRRAAGTADRLGDRLQGLAGDLRQHASAQDSASAAEGGGSDDHRGRGLSLNLPELPDLPDLTGVTSLLGGVFDPSKLADAFTFGPDDFDPIDWVAGTVENATGWTWDHIGVPVVNGLASFGNAMVNHPGATASMLLGLGMIGAGAAGEGLGVVLLPTGLVSAGGGTAAGAAVMVGSTELIAAGAGLVTVGGGIVLNEAVHNPETPASPREPQTYQPSGGGGQPPRSPKSVLGEMPAGKSSGVRTVGNDAELQSAYDDMARGGEVIRRPGYRGEWVRQPDGTEIGLRESSKSGGRTIDVRNPDGSTAKVHIK